MLLHRIVQWVLQVMFPSACCFIVCWFSLSFTTCCGLHGHLQVCRILHIVIFICLMTLLRRFFFFVRCLFSRGHTFACFSFVFCSCAVMLRRKTHKQENTKKPRRNKEGRNRHLKINIWRILHAWRWPCRPKHVVKDNENQHTIKLHADGNITCNIHWTYSSYLRLGHLCGLVVRAPGYKSKGPGSIPGITRFSEK
jgi:hypothetical protein